MVEAEPPTKNVAADDDTTHTRNIQEEEADGAEVAKSKLDSEIFQANERARKAAEEADMLK